MLKILFFIVKILCLHREKYIFSYETNHEWKIITYPKLIPQAKNTRKAG